MEAKTKDLWVLIQTAADGSAKSGLDLLTPGRDLAGKLGGALVAVVIGRQAAGAVQDACAYGADRVLLVEGEAYGAYSTDGWCAALCALAEKYGPDAILISADSDGRDLAPRAAARLGTGLAADCTGLDVDAEGCILWTRPVYGGLETATVKCAAARPQMGTVRPGVYKKGAPDAGRAAQVVREEVPAVEIRTWVAEFIPSEGAEVVDLEGAEIVVSGGRGMGGPEGFEALRALADALGATVGASRAAVDAGWIPHTHQVGQTGKTVAPKLYIACGISGAIQHLAGMSGSGCIVAVNKDPDAPIFGVADYGIVGNVHEVLPLLTQEILLRKA